jgi:hypothetical protein
MPEIHSVFENDKDAREAGQGSARQRCRPLCRLGEPADLRAGRRRLQGDCGRTPLGLPEVKCTRPFCPVLKGSFLRALAVPSLLVCGAIDAGDRGIALEH